MRTPGAYAGWMLALSCVACGGGGANGGVGDSCATARDCDAGLVCIEGSCRDLGDGGGDGLPDGAGDGGPDGDVDDDGASPPDGWPGDGTGDGTPPDGTGDGTPPDGAGDGSPPDGTGDGTPPDGTDVPPGDVDGSGGDDGPGGDAGDVPSDGAEPEGFWVDDDGDTYAEGAGDCNDGDARIHPGATEHIEGVDYDCDGRTEYLATLLITVDDWYERVCVNDVDVVVDPVGSRDWYAAESYTVVMESGLSVVGVHGVDLYEVISAFMMRIQVAGLTFLTTGISAGEPDTTPWRYSPDPDADPQADWCQPSYDDSAWGPARYVGEWGSSPWSTSPPELAGVGADWIWDDRPADLQDAWFRIEITLP